MRVRLKVMGQSKLLKLLKQSSPRDAQFLRGARKAARRDRAGLGCRRVLLARDACRMHEFADHTRVTYTW